MPRFDDDINGCEVIKGNREGPIEKSSDSWVPISVAAFLFGYSRVTVFNLLKTKKIRGLKYPSSPILVNLEDVAALILSK